MNIIGVDPGLSGGIALLTPDGATAWKIPETERDVWDLLNGLTVDFAYIEAVHSMPKQGVSSTFRFGVNYGGLRMALIAAGIPFETTTPQKWQQALGCRSKGDKNVTKRRAQELFPKSKVTHAIADALLLAEYGRRKHTETG